MCRVAAILTAALCLFSGTAIAEISTGGMGIILGEPTGISLKTWLSQDIALAAGAAWSFSDSREAFHFHADYLRHYFDVIDVEKGRMPLYLGIGTRVKTEDDTIVSVRIPLGISYIFQHAPVDIFLEAGPLLDVAPSTEAAFNAGAGLHYYF